MKKHIFGLAFFSFIVGATAIIYSMFNFVNVEEVFVSPQTSTRATSCWKMKRESRESKFASPIIKQAVFDLKTKQLNWELATPKTDSNLKIALHFFVKDDKTGARYINSALVPVSSNPEGTINGTSSFQWLDNLQSYENLYVIAEYISLDKFKSKSYQPKFDAGKAASVLLYSGEQGYLSEKYFRE